MANCEDFIEIDSVKPGKHYCEKCRETGDQWVHLRVCQDCGTTLCCDSSPNKHARAHFNEHGHSVIASAEKGEYWMWCYVHEIYQKY